MARPANILVVDDSLANSNNLLEILEAQGYLVSVAASAEEALPLFATQDFDVVLTGLMLSGMSCFNMMKIFKQRRPESDVIILSSNDSAFNVIKALRLGAYDFIVLPIDDETVLYNVIEGALEKQEQDRKKDHLVNELIKKNNGLHETLTMMKKVNEICVVLMSTFDIAGILKKLVEMATEHLHAKKGYILLLDKSGASLNVKVCSGIDPGITHSFMLPAGRGISGQVVASGKQMIVYDSSDVSFEASLAEEDPHGEMMEAPSILSVPIRVQGRTAGALTISGGVKGKPFNDDHLEFLAVLSRFTTIALSNAGVVHNLKKQIATSAG